MILESGEVWAANGNLRVVNIFKAVRWNRSSRE